MKKYKVALVGASGMVGETILKIMAERQFPAQSITLFASERSAGKMKEYQGQNLIIQALSEEAIKAYQFDFVLMSAGGAISKLYAPMFVAQGAIVIDNSSVWRMDESVPLVVPEVNPEAIQKARLIANPNCSTIQSVLPLKVLQSAYGIKRIVYSTYQAVSGSGIKGVVDLHEQTKKTYPHHIHRNIIPHIDAFTESGDTLEEIKMIEETRKILNHPDLKISATTVRVPIINTHAVSINVELEQDFDIDELRKQMAHFPGIIVMDDPANNTYPLAETAEGNDFVYVGRIRRDTSLQYGVSLWCVSDNIRKGAATNTVQIAEQIIKEQEHGII